MHGEKHADQRSVSGEQVVEDFLCEYRYNVVDGELGVLLWWDDIYDVYAVWSCWLAVASTAGLDFI